MRAFKSLVLAVAGAAMATFALASAAIADLDLQSSCDWAVTCDHPQRDPLKYSDAATAIHNACQSMRFEDCELGKGPLHPATNVTGNGSQFARAKIGLGTECGGYANFTVEECTERFKTIDKGCGAEDTETYAVGSATAACDGTVLWLGYDHRCADDGANLGCRAPKVPN